MVLDGHTYAPESMIMNLDFYNKLTDEDRAWIDEAAEYAKDTQRQEVTDMEEEMLASIEANGVKVCKDPDLQSFQDATASLYQEPAVTALVPPEFTEKVMTNTTIALIPMTAFVILSTRPDISHPPILSHAYFYTLQPPVLPFYRFYAALF